MPDESTRIQRLHEATSRLHGCSTREAAYQVVIDAAVDVLGFDWCIIAEADDGMFELVAVSDAAPVTVGDRHLATDEGAAGKAFQTGEPQVSDDTDGDDAAEPVDDAIRSGLTVPLEDWGIFQCAAGAPDAFDATDVEAAELLLSHAAEAFRRIDNEAALRRQNDRLDEFARVVSHDLRSPLGVAHGRLDLYRESGDVEDLDAVAGALDRMDSMIADLLEYAREGQTARDTGPVAVADAARAAWENVAGPGTLAVESDRVVAADRSRLVQLLENLFSNAIAHGRRGDGDDGTAPVAVTVGDTPRGFFIADDGPGIPAAERETVFETGYTTDADGTGFGLAIVAAIAEAHDWSVSVTDDESGGARFEIAVA